MIFIVTNSARESALLAALCEHRAWPAQTCETIAEFHKLAEKTPPRVVIMRQRVGDGYSDDILRWARTSPHRRTPRVIVLVAANCTIHQEARQVALGGDCVLRDPLRLEVLMEYIAKYRAKRNQPATSDSPPLAYHFAGVRVVPHEHRLEKSGRTVQVSPQVIALLRFLHHSSNRVAPYPAMYCELFNRKFGGDTSNCRVLLGKAAASFALLKVDLRAHIKVIPKSGYLYAPAPPAVGQLRPKSRER